jgi:acetoacetate decarboxylase
MSDDAVSGERNRYAWRDATAIWAEFPIERDLAARLLPPGYSTTDPPLARVFFADYPNTNFGTEYHEAALVISGTDDRGPFLHCPWMAVDDDVALFMGRELMGFPKVLGEVTMTIDGDALDAVVTRNGVEMLRLTGTIERDEPDAPSLVDHRWVNVVGSTLTGMSILEFGPGGEQVHGSSIGRGELTIDGSGDGVLEQAARRTEVPLRLVRYDCSDTVDGVGITVGEPITDLDWTYRRYFAQLAT